MDTRLSSQCGVGEKEKAPLAAQPVKAAVKGEENFHVFEQEDMGSMATPSELVAQSCSHFDELLQRGTTISFHERSLNPL